MRADVGTDEGKYLAQFALSTDDGAYITWNTITDPTENRSFAWATWAGYSRENGASDFIMPEVSGFAEFIVDPDVLIVKELWVAAASTKEGTVNPYRDWGYMVILEEKKISPSQSVFQDIA